MDHVLYFLADPSRAALRAAEEALEQTARRVSPLRARQVRIAFETSAVRALAKLRSGGAEALVIDARGEAGGAEESTSLGLLRGLFGEHDLARVIGREHTWIVVDADPSGAALAFEAGKLHLGGVIAVPTGRDAWEAIWERIASATSRGRGGRIALCLAGGGTEGLLYELGVLRALEHFLPGFTLADVDIICGISAGAILGGLLANGIDPDSIHEGLKDGSARLDRIRRSDLFDPNFGELGRRAASLSWDVVRGKRSPLSALFRLPPAGVFAGARLRDWLERQFARPGMADRFEDLPHRLFIGATDQDSGEHVVFGSAGAPTVPIHVAIRASTALAPFYAPEKIGGRCYVDGGFTRTTNMRVAVQEGATLVTETVDILRAVNLLPVASSSAQQGVLDLRERRPALERFSSEDEAPTRAAVTAAPAPELSAILKSLSPVKRQLMEALTQTPQHLDQISQRAEIPATEAGIEMIFLELEGLVRRLPGNTYIRTVG